MLKKLAILIGSAFVVLFILVGVILVVEDRAASRAREFCSRFTEGGSFAEVQRAAAGEGDARHRFVRDAEVSVAFVGVPPFSRHICIVEGSAGRITARRVIHLD